MFYFPKKLVLGIVIILFIWQPGEAQLPQRIISLSPNITEILFRLNAGNLVVGRTEFDLYPPAAREVPSVGGYLNPDLEKIVALHPDLILMLPNPAREAQLKDLGLTVLSIPDETLQDILFSIKKIGEIVSRRQRATAVIAGIQDTLEMVKKQGTARPPVTGALIVGREAGSLRGIYAAGKETYLSQLWELSGGKNIFADLPGRYFDIGKEDLLARDPDVILEFRVITGEHVNSEIEALQKDWEALSILKAIRNKQLYILPERFFLIPGPRITKIAIKFSSIISHVRSENDSP